MNWKVPLFDPDLGPAEEQALVDVIRSKWLTMGERTSAFERAFAQLTGVPVAVACNSATAALHMALAALDVGPGDDVVVPSLTFVATANAVRYCGARPVFADVASLDDWNVGAREFDRALTPATKAIIVVHYAGYPCDMEAIMALARRRGLAVVEDVAHAPAATLDDIALGAWGDAGCFSFFSNKNLTTAEGGMVTSRRPELAERLRWLRSHGMTAPTLDRHKGHSFDYDVVALGYNYRMSELNAALGLVQLAAVEARNEKRAALTRTYRERLSRLRDVTVPFATFRGKPSFHIMPVLLPPSVSRYEVMSSMREAGVQTSIHYRPIDTFTAYVEAGLGPCPDVPLTHRIGERGLTLPLFPSMTGDQLARVCDSLEAALAKVSSIA
ncbi:MAG TPA: DegT/DnrJ/EryC1/StrS aminotransferase family protein [Casimicrobiaceae bacterium]|nr:DegT/DnrJ/EryC1/StrS aminotransferase family protein [Casimicrobiaceae bacterium]